MGKQHGFNDKLSFGTVRSTLTKRKNIILKKQYKDFALTGKTTDVKRIENTIKNLKRNYEQYN